MPDDTARPDHDKDHVGDAVQAALAVPGVAGVRVEPDSGAGLALLRLELAHGADEADVARAVDEHLRRRAAERHAQVRPPVPPSPGPPPPIQPPTSSSQASSGDGEPLAVVTSGRLPTAHRPDPAPESVVGGDSQVRTARGTAAHATRPRPWETRPVVLPDTREPVVRLRLDRVQVMTRGMDVTATVVLSAGGRQHTGVCEAAATPGGHLRSLATATAAAMESATGGQCRFEVEATDVTSVAGQEAAVVVLSILSERGTETLTGACPVGDDAQRAMVKAVLAASNRRLSLQLAVR